MSKARCFGFVGMIALGSFLLAQPADALSITGLSIVKNGSNTADVGTGGRAATSTVQVLSSSPLAFQTRYAANVAADTGAFGGTINQAFTGNYTITFTVT